MTIMITNNSMINKPAHMVPILSGWVGYHQSLGNEQYDYYVNDTSMKHLLSGN